MHTKDIQALAAVALFYIVIESLGVTCPILFLTGISCAGCGMSRAWLSLLRLDLAGICASSGSACTSGSLDPSHVLLALGMPHEIAHGSLRLSLCEYNTMEEVDYILEQVPEVVKTLRQMSPVWMHMLEKIEDPYR